MLGNITNKLSKAAALVIQYSFRDHVTEDLAKHGSKRFSFISRESKAHLSIKNENHSSYPHSRDKRLAHQTSLWSLGWHPTDPALNRILNKLLHRSRSISKLAASQIQGNYDSDTLNNSTHTCNRNTKGIDVWTNTEIKRAPKRVKERLSTSIRYSFNKAVPPIQHLLTCTL